MEAFTCLMVMSESAESYSQAPEPSADAELVRRTLAGERQAFDQLIVRHQRQAMAVSLRLLGNWQDASDVLQDAFCKGFKSLASLQKPEAFGGWLMRIVSNLSLNYRRGRKLRLVGSLDEDLEQTGQEPAANESAGPMRVLLSRELGKRLTEALKQLPEKQRLAIVLFTIENQPQKQVAQTLDCSVEAVKWHVFQARKKLKELLKDCL